MTTKRPLRIRIPFLLDVVFVTDPAQIRKIETSGFVDRLHKYSTASLPWWVRFFFGATKFHDHERDLWFCPMEPASNPDYRRRREFLAEKAAMGYEREDVMRIAGLLTGNASEEILSDAMVQIVNRRFFGQEIPRSISRAAKFTLQNLGEAVWPWKYFRAKKSQQEIMTYCAGHLPKDVHILDVGHNIGEVVQTTTGALRTLQKNLDMPIERIFTSNPLTLQVPRIAVDSSTFEGLLRRPIRAGRTIIIFKIGQAAAETGDLLFTFGTGGSERVCVFKEFFLDFMRDLQGVLRER